MYSTKNNINQQLKIWLLLILSLITLVILVGGLTRLTDSGLSITKWELFAGFLPPFTNDKWIDYFNLYKAIPEYSEQNFNMTLSEFKVIFWWEWAHRQLGRLIGLTILLPLIYFSIIEGLWIIKKYGIIFILVCLQGFFGWYMVSSGLIDRVDVSHYRLSIHLVTAFIILSIVFWNFLKLTSIHVNKISIKLFPVKDSQKIFRKPILIIGISLFLQVLLGIITVISGVKIVYASLHQINSIVMILSTLYFLYISEYEEKNS